MQSNISKIVANHGLRPGDEMRNVKGEIIPNSVVLSEYNVLIGRTNGGYDLLTESPIDGEQSIVNLTNSEVGVLRRFEG